jgi:type IV secretion system protein VirB2
MPLPSLTKTIAGSKYPLLNTLAMFILITAFVAPGIAFGQDTADTGVKVCGFFQNINSLLNAASIVVVTIAVIFSGYQIAFAHKRIADVAPALIGGVLIGAAAQVAKMVVGGTGGATGSCTSASGNVTAMLFDTMHSMVQLAQHYA